MSVETSLRPVTRPDGWAFGRGILPFPRDPAHLWKLVNEVVDGRNDGVMVFAHHNADLDAAATALVMKMAFPWVKLGAYKSVSTPARKLLTALDEEMAVDPDLTRYGLVVIVDSSSMLQVSDGNLSSWPRHWVLDHHAEHDSWGTEQYVDPNMGACVEIALQMAMITNMPLEREMAVAGIAGIIADTGKFRFARPVDMSVCSFLLNGSDVRMEDVLDTIEGEEYFDVSKKIAQLKAMRRVQFQKVGDQVVATSRVTSFEAAAARALLVGGADVVFIAADRPDELRISSRAKPHILRLGVHLGHFMEDIGKQTGNQGGGHDGAAGLNGKGNADKILSLCMKRMAEEIERRSKGVKVRHEETSGPLDGKEISHGGQSDQ
jgi:nanoRNase/pAp phosphatase (c-di-AMP/oligoRNAs hydrolase)